MKILYTIFQKENYSPVILVAILSKYLEKSVKRCNGYSAWDDLFLKFTVFSFAGTTPTMFATLSTVVTKMGLSWIDAHRI